MAQGNVDSTDKWAAFFDPLLFSLDMVDDGRFFFQTGGGGIEAAKDTAAADNLVSFAGTHEALQAKANLVSAFCLIFGLEVAAHKLRCFHLTWGNPNRPAPTHILIHLVGWTPREVPLQSDGLMKHLGVRWDMSMDNDTQERLATTQLSTALARMSSMPCTMDLKRGVLEGSVFQSLAFHLRFAPWDSDRYHKLDDLVSRAWRRILKVDDHWPTELLYLAKEEGGIGLLRLSDLIHMRKLALVARFDQPDTLGRMLMSSISARNLNLTFTTPLGGGGQLREGAAPTWTTSLVEWMAAKELALHLSGPPAENLTYAPGADAPPVDYREYGLMLQAELGDGGEVPLRAAQCWLKPGSSDQKRTVCEILSFMREEDGDRAVLLS